MATVRYDAGNLANVRRTPSGGILVDASLTRTGIFTYSNPDGSIRREYRPAEEVFKEDALASFRGAPVTIGHPGLVNSKNWRSSSVGHVGDAVREDGKFVVAPVYIQDEKTVEKVIDGSLKEVSCGYQIDVDPTPGEHEGQRYDAVQRNIRGNHLALLPPGKARAGEGACLRLDSDGSEVAPNLIGMPDDNKKPDGPIQVSNMEVRVDGQPEIDRLKAENDSLKSRIKTLEDPARFDAAVNERVDLVATAAKIAPKFEPKGKSTLELKAAVVMAAFPNARLDGKSEEGLKALYEQAVLDFKPETPNEGLAKLRQDVAGAKEGSETPNTKIEAAQARAADRLKNAWKSK